MVHTRVIGQEDIGHETLILVLAVTLNRHRPPEDQGRRGPLRDLAERLAFLGAVNAIEADPLRLAVVQDVNGVIGRVLTWLSESFLVSFSHPFQQYVRRVRVILETT